MINNIMDLDRLESQIKDLLKESDKPFLGLFADSIDKESFTDVYEIFQQGSDDRVLTCCTKLIRYPALFATYIVIRLSQHYGDAGKFKVYPYLKNALAMNDDFSLSQKNGLWKSFRRACLRLGLSVSPRESGHGFMVGEYLRQMGIPINYVAKTTKAMLAYSKKVGFPDDDDPEGINLWRDNFIENAASYFLSAWTIEALKQDDTGYYIRLLLRLLSGDTLPDDMSEIESLMLGAIESRAAHIQKKIVIPRVVFRDQNLGIIIPGEEESSQRKWIISINDDERIFQDKRDAQFIPVFTDELPYKIDMRDKDEEIRRTVTVWENDKDNRLLIFKLPSGLLYKSISLQDTQIHLEPGQYVLLLRFLPDTENDLDQLSDDPDIYIKHLSLGPGEEYNILRSPASLLIKADDSPVMIWKGQTYCGLRGDDIYASKDLLLGLQIPSEMLDELRDSNEELVVSLNPGILGEVAEYHIRIRDYSAAQILIPVETYCREWKPGVCRLLAELRRTGGKRALMRSSLYLWNGLNGVDDSVTFHCDKLPDNLKLDVSENILIDENLQTISCKSKDSPFFRTVFSISNKSVAFTWPVPGIFLSIEDYSYGSDTVTTPLKKGAIVSVGPASRKTLKIHSSEKGRLMLGSFQREIGDNYLPVNLYLGSLKEYLMPNDNTLMFVSSFGIKTELITIVSPHEVVHFDFSKDDDQMDCIFHLKEKIEMLKIIATDLITGEQQTLDLYPHVPDAEGLPGMAWLDYPVEEGQDVIIHTLTLMLNRWPLGGWVLDFQVKINDRWEVLVNSRQDNFAIAFMIADQGSPGMSEDIKEMIRSLPLMSQIDCMRRMYEVLLKCYDAVCWEQIKWVYEIWNWLAAEIEPNDGLVLEEMLKISALRPPDAASSSWVPMIILDLSALWIYCFPISRYSRIDVVDSPAARCLYSAARISSDWFGVFRDGDIDVTPIMGFSNALSIINTGAIPVEFTIERYAAALKFRDVENARDLLVREDWRPGRGDYLGPLHYRYATNKLVAAYRNSTLGNEHRRGDSLMLARMSTFSAIKSKMGGAHALPQLPGKLEFINPFSLAKMSLDDLILEENLCEYIRFLSLFAMACRWDVRKPDTIKQFKTAVEQIAMLNLSHVGNHDFQSVLSYILHMGGHIFAFYLMLWEVIYSSTELKESA